MITDRTRINEYTGVHEHAPYSNEFSVQSDFVMVYGLDTPGSGTLLLHLSGCDEGRNVRIVL